MGIVLRARGAPVPLRAVCQYFGRRLVPAGCFPEGWFLAGQDEYRSISEPSKHICNIEQRQGMGLAEPRPHSPSLLALAEVFTAALSLGHEISSVIILDRHGGKAANKGEGGEGAVDARVRLYKTRLRRQTDWRTSCFDAGTKIGVRTSSFDISLVPPISRLCFRNSEQRPSFRDVPSFWRR